MTELINPNSAIARQIIALLSHYGFDLRGYTPDELATQWLNTYHEHWVRLAVIEALYQGRYKSISIEQLLNFWARRQHPVFHFNHEFERLICRKLPRQLTDLSKDPNEDIIPSSWNRAYLTSEVANVNSPPSSSPPVVSQPSDPVETETPARFTDAMADAPASVAADLPESAVAGSMVETTALDSITPQSEAKSELSSPNQDIEEKDTSEASIHRFTPAPDGSGCYRKLKAVAHQSRAGQETA